MLRRAFLAVCVLAICGSVASAADDPKAIVDKAIKAVGGEEKLSKIKGISMASKGTISFMGSDNEVSMNMTAAGNEKYRNEFTGNFGGMEIKGTTVVNGAKGAREFFGQTSDLSEEELTNEKRMASLSIIPVTLIALKSDAYKLEAAGEGKVGDKAAVGVKATDKNGKDFTIHFDKESGLPLKVSAKVMTFQMQEVVQETTYSDYKEVAGIKKAMKSSATQDGEKFSEMEVTEFKVLDTVDEKLFEKP